MKKIRLNTAIAIATLATSLVAAQAQAGLLTYEVNTPPVMDGAFIAASYGDVAGLVDVTHELTDRTGAIIGMSWWNTGYDDLAGVGWGGSGAGGDFGRVILKSVGGSTVTLNSLDLGVWTTGRGVDETLNIFEIGNATPLKSFIFRENANTHWTFDIDLSSTTGLIAEWTSPWWVAIDNLDSSARLVDVTPMPEPASAALLLLGLAGLARMRRQQV